MLTDRAALSEWGEMAQCSELAQLETLAERFPHPTRNYSKQDSVPVHSSRTDRPYITISFPLLLFLVTFVIIDPYEPMYSLCLGCVYRSPAITETTRNRRSFVLKLGGHLSSTVASASLQ